MKKTNSVLIVDDEKSNIMELTSILNKDYKVYAIRDSRLAVKTVQNDMPDVVLLDIIMPEVDGYEVIAALKDSENTHNIPVIFITGLDDIESEEKGLALGAADYIAKPFHPSIVKLRVRNQIKILEQYRIIERLSMLDQLTGIPNRRSFETRLKMEWTRSLREKTDISILMIDVDNFKNYNDSSGHQQGDVALVAVAKAISQTLKRPGDFRARWGGEEFIVLLPDTDPSGAYDVAEQIREGIEDTIIPSLDSHARSITVSIGVFTRLYGHACNIDEFITNADKALYAAKNTGRNRVCCFDG